MEPYQQRVIDEKRELDERLARLDEFVGGPKFPAVEPHEKQRLLRQRLVMRDYSQILRDRIAAFPA